MNTSAQVMEETIKYFDGDLKRINHLIKVYGFAKTIGELEGLDEKTREILEITAIIHDIGIKISEKRHNSSSGYYQQLEGPNEARTLLEGLGIEDTIIDRVCWLIAHHHTYDNIDEIDYQILVEADFLVNIMEDGLSKDAALKAYHNIFKTPCGKRMCREMFNI